MNNSSDSRLKEQIQLELKADPLLNKNSIEVDVQDGQAVLSGYVSTDAELKQAEEVAQRIAGVSNVVNSLGLQSTDTIITSIPDTTHHQDTPGSSGAFPVGAFDSSKD